MSHCVSVVPTLAFSWELRAGVSGSSYEESMVCGELEMVPLSVPPADQEKGKSTSTNGVFHGTNIRIETDYKKAFCKWRNASKKHVPSRHRMREMTVQKFLLCHQIILIIIKVATRLYIGFSFNPFKKQLCSSFPFYRRGHREVK